MINPRTPIKEKQPLFFALRAFLKKEGGHARAEPWISASGATKCLMMERNVIAGWYRFSTCCLYLSTGLCVFSTDSFFRLSRLFLSISLFLKRKERKKESCEEKVHPRVFETAYFCIHGLRIPSTGFPWIREIHKSMNFNEILIFMEQSTLPRLVLPLGNFRSCC